MAKKILIIDDDREVTNVILAQLVARGFHVELANDGKSGFEKARKFQPDVILLDIMMPGWSGLETANDLKTNPGTSDIPIIFITGMPGESPTLKSLTTGNHYVLIKPFMADQLLSILSNNLGM